MKKIATFILLTCCALAFASISSFAQSGRVVTPPADKSKDERSASALYDEAAGYTARKFREFADKKISFNPKLAEQTYKEQKELAARYATELSARQNLTSDDLYYLGLLYHLSSNEERTVETFNRFLEANQGAGARQQFARYIVVLRLAESKHFAEAESQLADYLRFEPRKTNERVGMENALTAAYHKDKQLDRAVAHAEEAYQAAKSLQPTAQNVDAVAQVLYKSSSTLVDIYQELKRPEKAATSVLEEVRKLAQALPSMRLYVDATEKLADVFMDNKHKADAVKTIESALDYAKTGVKRMEDQRYMFSALERKQNQLRIEGEAAPEITVAKWIEQSPLKLSDLRGHVVLLDFWATWCGPCLAAFPHLREWNEKYKTRGLVVLGITKYYGRGDGQEMTPPEENSFLERFKKEHNLTYGVGVADTDNNLRSYGVQAIPTAVLIDRQGVIRLVTTGSGGGNETTIESAIEKLLEEK
jgi:thiol-disulfide isomerase/thioredoxin